MGSAASGLTTSSSGPPYSVAAALVSRSSGFVVYCHAKALQYPSKLKECGLRVRVTVPYSVPFAIKALAVLRKLSIVPLCSWGPWVPVRPHVTKSSHTTLLCGYR